MKPMHKQLHGAILDTLSTVAYMMLAVFVMRLLEYWYLVHTGIETFGFRFFIANNVWYDWLLIGLIGFGLLLFNLIFSRWCGKCYLFLNRVVLLLVSLVFLALTHYYLTNNELLTAFVFSFSIEELQEIVSSEFNVSRLMLWSGHIIVWLLLCALLVLNKGIKVIIAKNLRVSLAFMSIIILWSLGNCTLLVKPAVAFDSNNAFYLGNNKLSYLLSTIGNNEALGYSMDDLNRYQNNFPDRTYVSHKYPLVYKSAYTSELSPFFEQGTTAPDIVFILAESLSATFSGSITGLGFSLTPFIDSLGGKGLYWDHFFSNAYRTYGVIPNMLGSLPSSNGDRGFLNSQYKNEQPKGSRFPKHEGLLKLLSRHNYDAHFYYGGWLGFDNAHQYLMDQGITDLYHERNFDTTKFHRLPSWGPEHSWGYDDKLLFAQGLDRMESYDSLKSHVSVFQTLSIHSPFNMCRDAYYERAYLESRYEKYGLSKEQLDRFNTDILASILYTDDAVREFMEAYSKSERYDNTIFIVVGDHGIDFNLSDKIFENYHVPFVIYSPLLKQSKNFHAVSSHIDVIPSLLGLLEANFGMQFPKYKMWLGQGLDTSAEFVAKRYVPMELGRGDIPVFIYNQYVIDRDHVYELSEDLSVSLVQDTSVVNKVMREYKSYREIGHMVCEKDRIWNENFE